MVGVVRLLVEVPGPVVGVEVVAPPGLAGLAVPAAALALRLCR